jgi:hypothetical protein
MPKLIDYPRTTYTGAWELAEITDDTGGKCTIETAARKLNRKVSGSFKAIIGSAVKFGLLTSKRDLLTTTTLFKRIKHAYDKQEELLFHREAFLTPPLFTQLCRKFRSRELPVQMLDVMLIREFGVEEINAQGVAKAFVEGCRMVGLLDERNMIADIDAIVNKMGPRRELASPPPAPNTFRDAQNNLEATPSALDPSARDLNEQQDKNESAPSSAHIFDNRTLAPQKARTNGQDAIASLFGLLATDATETTGPEEAQQYNQRDVIANKEPVEPTTASVQQERTPIQHPLNVPVQISDYQIQVSGPGVNTLLTITDEDDIAIAIALLQKIRRQLKG